MNPTQQADLTHLIQAAQTGDRAAMEQLLEQVQPLLYRFGVRMCGEPEDAKDVLQESLLAVARALPSFRGEASASTWLYTIARNFCIKKRRRSKFAPAYEQGLEQSDEAQALADHAPRPDEALEQREARRLLEQALLSLEPIYREVFVLRDLEGLSAQEAAAVLEISVEALKSRLHRARAMIRAQLAPLREETPPPNTCPEITLLFSRYLEGEIDAIQCAEMEQHLSGCPRCRSNCDSLKHSLAVCKAAPTPAIPSALQSALRASIRRLLESKASP